jgi:photosystem II stability/assembly factor-like uncharacterized protein
MKKNLLFWSISLLLTTYTHAQLIKTVPYWAQQKTDAYPGKQDDIFFLNDSLGWYINGYGKIYKTWNGGTDWKLITEKKGTFFRCIGFIDSLNGFVGNIGTDYFPNVTDTVPLYRTTDGGNTWTPVEYKGPRVKGLCAINIVQEPIINAGNLAYRAHVYCGGRVGSPAFTMMSHDNGKTFQSQDMSKYCAYILDIKFFNVKEGIICAASEGELEKTNARILITKDGGKTWKATYTGKRPFENVWKCYFPTRKIGYGTIQSYDTAKAMSNRYVIKTTDGGNTWKELPLVKDMKVREFGVGFTDELHGWVGAVPYGFETFDGGKSWTPSYMGPAANKFRVFKNKQGDNIAYSIGVIVSKNKEVIRNGYDALEAMRNAYSGGRWYKNFTFSQDVQYYKDGKEDKKQVWHEAATFPGKLVIKYDTKDSKNGALFENNKLHIYQEGKDVTHLPMVHDLLLAGFDVYFLRPYETSRLFDSLGYNLKKVREDEWKGRKVLVIGADKGDSLSPQIWIDSERFYLHRIVYKQRGAVRDVTFEDYVQMENNWVAKFITFKQNGQLQMTERYFDIKFPKEIKEDTYKAEKFNEVKLE